MLTEMDVDIVIFDANERAKTVSEEQLSGWLDRLLLVGISAMIGRQILDALELSKLLKRLRPEIPVIWGGALPTLLPELVVKEPSVDMAVMGQGEFTMKEIAQCLLDGFPIHSVKGGVSMNEKGECVFNARRDFADLNSFPPYRIVYHLVELPKYIWPDEHISSKTISYHSSQGCPYSCGFCAEVPLWKRRWSGLKVETMIDDIIYLMETQNIDGVKFYDSEFFIDKDRATRFAKTLLHNQIVIKWGASGHPKRLLSYGYENLRLLRDSGLRRLLVGVESSIESERKLVGKNIKEEEIFAIAEICADLGIYVCFTFVLGYPGVPHHNIRKSLDFAHALWDKHRQHEVKIHFYAPYPGTLLYNKALQHGFSPPKTIEEWAEYDYYKIMTPWIPEEYFKMVRKFNERYYPYLNGRKSS
jgi:anaerobic magnesium-protoporphyrin IX monomethyl ester cyclase